MYNVKQEDVEKVQKILNDNGYNVTVDGMFGAETSQALQNYFSSQGDTGVAENLKQNTPNYAQHNDAYNQAMASLQNAAQTKLTSQYTPAVQQAYEAIVNRPKFSYDMNTDELYKIYRDQYTRNGQRAMEDTMAQASGLTGGYGSTYAETAAAQQYQNYMDALNERVPELYQAAYNRYMAEGNDMWQNYNALSNMEATDLDRQNNERAFQYNAAAQDLANYWTETQYNADRADSKWNQDFQAQQADRDFGRWAVDFSANRADTQWNQSFQQSQADRAYSEWLAEFNASRQDAAWQKGFQQSQAANDYALSLASLAAKNSNSYSTPSYTTSYNETPSVSSTVRTRTNDLSTEVNNIQKKQGTDFAYKYVAALKNNGLISDSEMQSLYLQIKGNA